MRYLSLSVLSAAYFDLVLAQEAAKTAENKLEQVVIIGQRASRNAAVQEHAPLAVIGLAAAHDKLARAER